MDNNINPPSRSYNAFGRLGCLFKDPSHVFRLRGSQDCYGDSGIRWTVEEVRLRIEWLTMATYGVPAGEAHKVCQQTNASMVVTNAKTGREAMFAYNHDLETMKEAALAVA